MDTTIEPAPRTPWDKKTERLEAAIARVDAEIAAVNTRHADKIKEHNEALAVRDRVFVAAYDDEQRAEGRLLGARDMIAQLEQQLVTARNAVRDAEAAYAEAKTETVAAQTRLLQGKETRAAALAEPNRHLAALAHDKRRLLDRLALHKARAPRPALFG